MDSTHVESFKKKNCTYFKEKKSDPFSIGMNFFVLFSGVSFFLVYCNQLRWIISIFRAHNDWKKQNIRKPVRVYFLNVPPEEKIKKNLYDGARNFIVFPVQMVEKYWSFFLLWMNYVPFVGIYGSPYINLLCLIPCFWDLCYTLKL